MAKRKAGDSRASPTATKENQPCSPAGSDEEAPKKRAPRRKPAQKEASDPPVVLPVWTPALRPPPLAGAGTRILSWNVASLRSLLTKAPGTLAQLAEAEAADVLCLQETKLQEGNVPDCEARLGLPAWHCAWACSTAKKGYSGTAILSRHKPVSVRYGIGSEEHDGEGRVITAEYPSFHLVNVYVPNSGDGLKRLAYRTESWDADFAAYLCRLGESKPVILTGDVNCAHQEIDIHEPKRNARSAGFTQEERDSFAARLLGQCGFVDAFRHQYPQAIGYTYWNYRTNARAGNKGWRLDYFLVAGGLMERVHECYHLPHVLGSDHCPVGLVLRAPPT